jgi:hypothetical protein
MMAVKVSDNEFLWREWVLGRERYAGKGPRSSPRPDVGFGGPGQDPVPKTWWSRLEEFIARAENDSEPEPAEPPPRPFGRTQLSPHFNVREFDCHDGKNVPQVAEPACARLCVQFLEPLRAKFGPALVLSGYRHKAYNAKIGGAKASQHNYDDDPSTVAADLSFRKGSPSQWALEARRLSTRLGFGGVGEYPPNRERGGFVHVDNRRYKARWSG